MAESKVLTCDVLGEVIPEGEEHVLFIDYKGKRQTFYLSETAFASLAEHLSETAFKSLAKVPVKEPEPVPQEPITPIEEERTDA